MRLIDWPGLGLEQEVEVVAHEAIAVEFERVAFLKQVEREWGRAWS